MIPDARRIALAVAVGLVVGKFIGVTAASFAALKLRIGRLPEGVDRRSLLGLAALAGIGFTVSLFIAPLAFTETTLLYGAKTGVFAGSLIAAIIGIAVLAPGGRHRSHDQSEFGP